MTYVVAFSAEPLSERALERATAFADATGEDVVAVTAIPDGNRNYARERGWLDPERDWDRDAVLRHLRETAAEVAPAATVRHEFVDRYAPRGTIARTVRRVARETDADVVFVGSENAGRVVGSITSVGGNVASDPSYDVHIVRTVN